ncbi:MAG: hypothetical protein ACR2IE_00775 [Candidatus Sumerlaeaceae bacterium]
MNRFRLSIFSLPVVLFFCLSTSRAAVVVNEPEVDPGATSSAFGFALAASGSSLFVGAPYFDRGDVDSGWTFTFDISTLAPTGHINTFSAAGSHGGAALAAGRNDLLVGVPSYNSSVGDADYITPTGGVGIANPSPAANDEFGRAVAVGKKQLVIGAPGDAGGPGPELSGSAFVASKRDLIIMRLPLPSYTNGDSAGYAVAISNKLIAVGARGTASGSIASSGAVHVYDAKTHAFLITLTFSNPFTGPRFGESLAFSGNNLFIGAPGQDFGSPVVPGYVPAAGAVYQFNTKTMQLVRTFVPSSPQDSSGFGTSISADRKRLLVGSPKHDTAAGTDAGKADLFDLKTGVFHSSLFSDAPAASEYYGQSVLLMKRNRAAVGAPAPDNTSNDGHVYVHTLVP